MQEVSVYCGKNFLRDSVSLVPAAFTAVAYGTLYNAQFELFLEHTLKISIDFIPAWIRVSILSLLMGSNNFALNFMTNREHWEAIKYKYNQGLLWHIIKQRLAHHPLETLITLLGGFAEGSIVVFSLDELLNGKKNGFYGFIFAIGLASAIFSGFQYATVDGESLIEAINEGMPPLDNDIVEESRWTPFIKNTKKILAYLISSIGAITMGLLAYQSTQHISNTYLNQNEVRKAYWDLFSIHIGIIYASLDFTLYGRELIKTLFDRYNNGRWDFPNINTKMRKLKLLLALIGSALMGIVGFDALETTFYPKRNAPAWTFILFIPPALLTALQILNTEGKRLIKLNYIVEAQVEDINSHETYCYHITQFGRDFFTALFSTLSASMFYFPLTSLYDIPQNFYTASAALTAFAAVKTSGELAQIYSDHTNPSNQSANTSLGRKVCQSISSTILLWLACSLIALLWKLLLNSSVYKIDSETADKNCIFAGLFASTIALFAEEPITKTCAYVLKTLKSSYRSVSSGRFFSIGNILGNNSENYSINNSRAPSYTGL